MKGSIILIGGGGHCKSCIDVIEKVEEYKIAGIVDTRDKLGQKLLGYECLATDDDFPELVKTYPYFLITLGQVRSVSRRVHIFNKLKMLGACLPIVSSPHAYVSTHAHIGEGTVIMHYALVNAGTKIGVNCIINTKALIEHDATIGNHCHISTGAIVNGGVQIGDQTFFGSGAVSKECIGISSNSFIKANTLVEEDQ